ncbi:GLUG motif-containing protein [Methanolapillus ohkumae]|uniref:GLUG domain-containing protein n=1 Tax=Methanolapillus ohkumae TaxID=3028298 RepID=A0AA96ZY58_9EURY|nr:hypothetical protein MsAm2_16160 [Methanosarcinaceae archaeon Am2]
MKIKTCLLLFIISTLIFSINPGLADDSKLEKTEKPEMPEFHRVQTADDFKKIGNDWGLDGKYTLIADIEIVDETWQPIGSASRPFTGSFSGQFFTITFSKDTKLIQPDGPETNGEANGYGLFGNVEGEAQIHNLTVILKGNMTGENNVGPLVGIVDRPDVNRSIAFWNCSVQSQNNAIVIGKSNVGGIVGSWKNGTIENISSDVTVKAESENAGGLIGNAYVCNISDSFAAGDVKAGQENAGGLIGYVKSGRIFNTYAAGNISSKNNVGGFIGYISDEINLSYCTATGVVKTDESKTKTGFFGGENGGNKSIVNGCFYRGVEVN